MDDHHFSYITNMKHKNSAGTPIKDTKVVVAVDMTWELSQGSLPCNCFLISGFQNYADLYIDFSFFCLALNETLFIGY
jgi:hypothetical protein